MTEKDRNDVLDWLNQIVNPGDVEWTELYSESEIRLLAKNAIELIIPMYKDKVATIELEMASGELIHCKDCKHNDACEIAYRFGEKEDWFCADGIPKDS